MTNIITTAIDDVEAFFQNIGTTVANFGTAASNIVTNIKNDINYLQTTAVPAFEKWFSANVQYAYTFAHNALSLAATVTEEVYPAIAGIVAGIQAAIAAIESFFETTGAQVPGGTSPV